MLSKTRFRTLQQLTRKKERVAQGKFVVEGWRWLEEVLGLPEPPECVLVVADAARSAREAGLLERVRAQVAEFYEVTPEQMTRLTNSVSPPGVAAVVRWRPANVDGLLSALPTEGPALVLALDGVGDPGNVGTIVRTADWFHAAGVLVGPDTAELSNPKTMRATMGSLFHLPIACAGSLGGALERLRIAGFSTVGAALEGDDMRAFSWPSRCVLVIGNEANGIEPALLAGLDHRVRIPSFGRAESLNAAVAASLLAADWRFAENHMKERPSH